MAELVFPAPWLCALLALLPVGLFAGLYCHHIESDTLREVWRSLFYIAAIPHLVISPVEQIIECAILTCATFVGMLFAWYLGLRVQQPRR